MRKSSPASSLCFSARLQYDHLKTPSCWTRLQLHPSRLSALCGRFSASPGQDCTTLSLVSALRLAPKSRCLFVRSLKVCIISHGCTLYIDTSLKSLINTVSFYISVICKRSIHELLYGISHGCF